MKQQLIIVFTLILLMPLWGQAQEISIINPIPIFGQSKSSGPQNIAISPYLLSPLKIDLNEDGINDISISGTHYVTTDYPSSAGSGWVSINTLSNYIWSDDYHALPKLSSPQTGETSIQNGSFNKGSFVISGYSENYILGTTTGWTAPWDDIDIGYLSVLFRDSSNQLHAASIRLLVPDDGGFFMSMYIMDWFYGMDPLPEPPSTGSAVLSSGDQFQMAFSVHSGLQYALEQCTNLVEGVWSTNAIYTATAETLSITNNINSKSGFFRLKRMP
ncbi:MAG: hypothetical protein JXR23_09545 [Pontiellaceae bacterium]|nr:hypothetical protein [Pontiellaceae bacterium]